MQIAIKEARDTIRDVEGKFDGIRAEAKDLLRQQLRVVSVEGAIEPGVLDIEPLWSYPNRSNDLTLHHHLLILRFRVKVFADGPGFGNVRGMFVRFNEFFLSAIANHRVKDDLFIKRNVLGDYGDSLPNSVT